MEKILANIEIEIFREGDKNFVYLSNDGSSGCKYQFADEGHLQRLVADYVVNCYKEKK